MIRTFAIVALAAGLALPAIAQQAPDPDGDAAPAASASSTAVQTADSGKPRVGITADMADATWTTPAGETVTVSRDQTPGAVLSGDWALIGQDCPPFCIQPMVPAPGVTTVGELELIEAMKAGDTILVDGRTSDWYTGGTIPGAINIPYTEAVERLAELGCEPDFDGSFDCAEASKVILFCNGIWCGQSPAAIRAMIAAGYPADRISYYRGGMLAWRLLGLTVAGGGAPAGAAAAGAQDAEPQAAADNPVTDGTTEEAAATPLAPVEGEATAETPVEGAAPADAAAIDNAAKAGNTVTPGN